MNDYAQNIKSSQVVLVEFFATWCPHCQKMMPVMAEIREKLEDKIGIFQYDIDKYEQLSDDNKIETVPTFIVYSRVKEVWRRSGEVDMEVILNKLRDAADGL